MRFFCIPEFLDKFQDQEYTSLFKIRVNCVNITAGIKSNHIQRSAGGWGFIIEADESLRTLCVIKNGFDLDIITDDEYNQLVRDGKAEISDIRAMELSIAYISQLAIMINSR